MEQFNFDIGDILFYETETIVGKIIRKVTGFKYSHVALVIDEHCNVLDVNAFIKSRKINFFKTDYKSVKVLRIKGGLTEKQKRELVEKHKNLLGKKYDYLGILFLFFKLKFGLKVDKYKDDYSKFWCSEIVDYIYNELGIDLVPEVTNNYVTIEELYKSPLLQEVYEFVK